MKMNNESRASRRPLSTAQIHALMNIGSTKEISEDTGISQSTLCKMKKHGGTMGYNSDTVEMVSDYFLCKLDNLEEFLK